RGIRAWNSAQRPAPEDAILAKPGVSKLLLGRKADLLLASMGLRLLARLGLV
ncbi:unnamed protein product, partial [Effrenium voratum]